MDAAFPGLPAAHSSEGYAQGYARGTRDRLALYPLLIEQFVHGQHGASADVRAALRAFGRHVADRLGSTGDAAAGTLSAGFIDGGGI